MTEDSQRRLEDAVRVARRLAHAYSNILTSIVGFTEMGLSQVPATSPVKRYLDVVFRSAQQGVALTQRLRLLGCRVEPGATGARLHSVLARQVGRRTVAGSQVEEQMDVPADLPALALSAEQLSTLVECLLDNAYEALEGKGRVGVTARVVELAPEELQDRKSTRL